MKGDAMNHLTWLRYYDRTTRRLLSVAFDPATADNLESEIRRSKKLLLAVSGAKSLRRVTEREFLGRTIRKRSKRRPRRLSRGSDS